MIRDLVLLIIGCVVLVFTMAAMHQPRLQVTVHERLQ